ncbi:MAG: branched-chain amino acid ABC transporter permease [Thermacetogeniaceae bacterium]
MFFQQLVNGITIGSLYSLVALGLTMVYGIMRVLDIANAGAYTLGAYLGVVTYMSTRSIVLALLAGIVGTALTGYLLQLLVYTPLKRLGDPIIPLVASIGLFTVIQDLIRLIAGPYTRSFPVHLPFDRFVVGHVVITGTQLIILITAAVLFTLLWFILDKTKIGLAWQATAQDAETAMAMGINTNSVMAFAFMLGYILSAVSGILVGIHHNAVFPSMGNIPSYKMLAIVVLGGLGSPIGAVAASMLIGLCEAFVTGYIGSAIPTDAIAFLALLIVLLVRPQGLFGIGGVSR